jgi:Type II secretion system (T2SS), protein E, N-terminal domain
MQGGKRSKSLEERLQAARGSGPESNGGARREAGLESNSIADALAEYAVEIVPETAPERVAERPVEPAFEAAFKARFEALLQETSEPLIPEPIEALLVDESSGPTPPAANVVSERAPAPPAAVALVETRDDLGDFAAPVSGYRPPPVMRATDRELSEVHDQLEALRTSASEGDTFLPAGAAAPSSVPPAPSSVPPAPPASSSFLDRFSIRGARSTASKETFEPEPIAGTVLPPPKAAGDVGRVGRALIARGLITGEQYEAALEIQRSTGRRIGDSLIDMDAISSFELVRVLADHMGVPFVDLQAKPPDPLLATMVPEDVARRYDALPVAWWNHELVIAMANPTDVFALDDLQMVTRHSIIPAMALLDDLRAEIDRTFRVS